MRVVEISVLPIDDETPASAVVKVWKKKGNDFVETERMLMESSNTTGWRKILLGDDEKVEIGPVVQSNLVYDRDQRAYREMTDEEKDAAK